MFAASVVQWHERRFAKAEAPGSIPGRRTFVAVTQLGRVPVFQTGCRGFDAHPLHGDLRLPI